MVYDANDTGSYCATCGVAEFSGHRVTCWKPDVKRMTEGCATLVKYQYMGDVTNTGGDEDDEREPNEDTNNEVRVCDMCFRGRNTEDQIIQDCYCGALKFTTLICVEAQEQLTEWFRENGFAHIAEEFERLLELVSRCHNPKRMMTKKTRNRNPKTSRDSRFSRRILLLDDYYFSLHL